MRLLHQMMMGICLFWEVWQVFLVASLFSENFRANWFWVVSTPVVISTSRQTYCQFDFDFFKFLKCCLDWWRRWQICVWRSRRKIVKLGEIWIELNTAQWVSTNRATFLPEQDVHKKYIIISLSTEFVQSSDMDIILNITY